MQKLLITGFYIIAETSTPQINEAEKRTYQNQIPTVELSMLATLSSLLALANTSHSFPGKVTGISRSLYSVLIMVMILYFRETLAIPIEKRWLHGILPC